MKRESWDTGGIVKIYLESKHHAVAQEVSLWGPEDPGTACHRNQEYPTTLLWLTLEGVHTLLNHRQ